MIAQGGPLSSWRKKVAGKRITQTPRLYPERDYEELVATAPVDITPEQDLLAFDQLHFALASRVEPDGQGRLLLPQKILRRAGIQKEVTLIGVRDHLEVWNRGDWEARIEELEKQAAEIAIAAKRQRRQQNTERPAVTPD